MNGRTVQQCQAGAAGGALSNEQKKRVVLLARAAWAKLGKPGFADQAADVPAEIRLKEAEAFDLWRHTEQRKAAGTAHLTCAENRSYPSYMSHFARLAGQDQNAAHWVDRQIGDPQRQAQSVLERELKAAETRTPTPPRSAAASSRRPTSRTFPRSRHGPWCLTSAEPRRNAEPKRRECHSETH